MSIGNHRDFLSRLEALEVCAAVTRSAGLWHPCRQTEHLAWADSKFMEIESWPSRPNR
jgi:hypothetical protein